MKFGNKNADSERFCFYIKSDFFCKRRLKKVFFSKNPNPSTKKDKCQFSKYWGKLWQNSSPVCYISFKNWNNKLVSDLMSMLNYTRIVNNAALWSSYTSEGFSLNQWIACWPWDSKVLLLNLAISRTMVTGTEFTYSVS